MGGCVVARVDCFRQETRPDGRKVVKERVVVGYLNPDSSLGKTVVRERTRGVVREKPLKLRLSNGLGSNKLSFVPCACPDPPYIVSDLHP